MPAWMLPRMTTTAKAATNTATPISTERCAGPALCESSIITACPNPLRPCSPSPADRLRRRPLTMLFGRQEPAFLHQRLVALLFVLPPLGVVGDRNEALVE